MPERDVSVLIPVYNGASFLSEAIDSVLRQAEHVRELIVLDNASTDETAAVVELFDDPIIRYERQPSLVPAWQNWTDVSQMATAPLVKVLCADDRLVEGSVHAQREALHRYPTAKAAIGRKRVITERGFPIGRVPSAAHTDLGELTPWALALREVLLAGGNALGEPACVLFRTDALKSALPWSSTWRFLLDLDMYARTLQGSDVVLFEDVHAEFRISSGSWSTQLKDDQTAEFLAWAESIEKSGGITLSAGDWRRVRIAAGLRGRGRRIAYVVADGIDRVRR